MKFTLTTTITMLLTLGLISCQGKICSDHCASCTVNGTCNACFRRYLYRNKCLSVTTAQSHCMLFNSDGVCIQCNQGYATPTNPDFEYCYKIDIEDCTIAHASTQHAEDVKCNACRKGFPSSDGSSCQPWESGSRPNCLWGGIGATGPECWRCDHGFVIHAGKCVAQAKGFEGCAYIGKDGKCHFCDVWGKYYMFMVGKCKPFAADEPVVVEEREVKKMFDFGF